MRKKINAWEDLSHENLLEAKYNFIDDDQDLFIIVTSLCDSGNLKAHIGKLNQEEQEKYMMEIVQGM